MVISSPRRIAAAPKERPIPAADRSPATEAVLARLAEPIPMPFSREVPLDFALKTIEQATRTRHPEGGILFLVDAAGLKRARRSLDSKILLELEGVSLRTSLRLMLGQLGLTYVVRDGLVLISSPERLETLREKPAAAPVSQPATKG